MTIRVSTFSFPTRAHLSHRPHAPTHASSHTHTHNSRHHHIMSYLFTAERPEPATLRDSRGFIRESSLPLYATAAQLKQWQQEQDELAATSFLVPANGHHAETQRRRRAYECMMRAGRSASTGSTTTTTTFSAQAQTLPASATAAAPASLMTSTGVLPQADLPATDFLSEFFWDEMVVMMLM